MNASAKKKTIWSIVIFCCLVTALAFLSPFLGGSPSSPGPGFVLWGTAPLLVALLMRTVMRDWSDAGLKPEIRKNTRWYILSLFVLPAAFLFALLVGVSTRITSVSGFSVPAYLKTVLPALAVFFIFAFFEEFGWRGYLAPKLASLGMNTYLSSVIVGVVWAAWHLPFIRELAWLYSAESFQTFIPRFFLAMVIFSILYSEIRTITGTFWPAVLMHCSGNAFGHPLVAGYIKVRPGLEYLGSVSDGFFTIVFIGLAGIALHQWRIRKGSASKSPA